MSTTRKHQHAAITAEHRERFAYVYIRQSTMFQVRHNTASTERQYLLSQRAYDLGWAQERIITIDEDQGHSGAFSGDRPGFQRLVLDVSLGRVGALLGLEISRLARSWSDWARLLELCALTHCSVIDEDGIYDPTNINDRLVLGMKATISEYELHFLKTRMLHGKLHKAQQGQLRVRLPGGYIYESSTRAILDPDEQVQHAVRLVFSLFEPLGSALAVVKAVGEQQLLFPTRQDGGARHGELTWHPLGSGRVLQILHNPVYAGAYVYGRSLTRTIPGDPGMAPQVHTRQVPLGKWPILIHDVYPAYITWDRFLLNQKRLDDNRTNQDAPRPGTIRAGAALLQGLVICGNCGQRMSVRYAGGKTLSYVCAARHKEFAERTCQTLGGQPIDQAVGQALLHALTPAQLALSVQTLNALEQQAARIDQQWQQRLECARDEAHRAQRQFALAEPENRLVVRTLERTWEEKLQELERLQRDYDTRPRPKLLTLRATDRQHILSLAKDLPALWNAPTTTNQERKQVLRLLITDVTLSKTNTTIQIVIRWHTNATTAFEIPRPRLSCEQRKAPPALIEQIRTLAKTNTDRQIAPMLNQHGQKSPTGKPFSHSIVQGLRWTYQIPSLCLNHPLHTPCAPRGDGRYPTKAVANLLNVDISTVNLWCHQGKLDGIQEVPHGPWWIHLSPQTITELRRSEPRKRSRGTKPANTKKTRSTPSASRELD
jgi:DNA invertase Pin-like site-specific DNA recombinase